MFCAEAMWIAFLHICISGTLLCVLSQCQVTRISDLTFVNCSSRRLIEVPVLPKHAFSVDLSKNKIERLVSDSTFSGMKKLTYLDLSDNPLYQISTRIFQGLKNLTRLYIRRSYLYIQKDLVLNSLLFGLENLKHLSFTLKFLTDPLDCYWFNESRPFGTLDALYSIESLEIDSALVKWTRNDSYKTTESKTKFLYLINGRFCFYNYLSKKQLDYMPFLENCTVELPFKFPAISPDIFLTQKSLKSLTIFGSKQSEITAPKTFLLNVTKSMQQKKEINSLTFQHIRGFEIITCHDDFAGLEKATSLRTISLIGMGIKNLELGIFNCFPLSLKRLYLQRNCMSLTGVNIMLRFAPQIQVLDASDQNICDKTTAVRTQVLTPSKLKIYSLQNLSVTYSRGILDFGYETDYFKYLTYLDISHNEKMTNQIPHFFSANRPNLTYLNMSHCRIVHLHNHSFEYFTELQYLDLSWNNLGRMGCSLSERFDRMEALLELDLSKNYIHCIQSTIFQTMRRIKKINLNTNSIQTFEADLSELNALTDLDLSHNKLQKLSDNTIKDLDLLSKSHDVHLNLDENLLLCTCETMNFLRWLVSTKVHLIASREYVCCYGNGTITTLKDISSIIEHLTDKCTAKTTIIVSKSAVVAFCLSVCLIAFGTVIIYRCRWRLRYWYYKFHIKTRYQTRGHDYEHIFEYDMFISYSSEDHEIARQGVMDELESKRGLPCCIHERDFQPGESIAYNIARGIRESKRTALFLSKTFLKSEWCLYELNIARMEELHTKRKVMLVIMLDSIAAKSLPLDILDVINTFTYLEYPREGTEGDLDIFWSKCADFANE